MTQVETKERQVVRSTLVITNAIKLAGLIGGLHELFTTRDPYFMGASLLMMSGMIGLEQVLLKAIERFFGVNE